MGGAVVDTSGFRILDTVLDVSCHLMQRDRIVSPGHVQPESLPSLDTDSAPRHGTKAAISQASDVDSVWMVTFCGMYRCLRRRDTRLKGAGDVYRRL